MPFFLPGTSGYWANKSGQTETAQPETEGGARLGGSYASLADDNFPLAYGAAVPEGGDLQGAMSNSFWNTSGMADLAGLFPGGLSEYERTQLGQLYNTKGEGPARLAATGYAEHQKSLQEQQNYIAELVKRYSVMNNPFLQGLKSQFQTLSEQYAPGGQGRMRALSSARNQEANNITAARDAAEAQLGQRGLSGSGYGAELMKSVENQAFRNRIEAENQIHGRFDTAFNDILGRMAGLGLTEQQMQQQLANLEMMAAPDTFSFSDVIERALAAEDAEEAENTLRELFDQYRVPEITGNSWFDRILSDSFDYLLPMAFEAGIQKVF